MRQLREARRDLCSKTEGSLVDRMKRQSLMKPFYQEQWPCFTYKMKLQRHLLLVGRCSACPSNRPGSWPTINSWNGQKKYTELNVCCINVFLSTRNNLFSWSTMFICNMFSRYICCRNLCSAETREVHAGGMVSQVLIVLQSASVHEWIMIKEQFVDLSTNFLANYAL